MLLLYHTVSNKLFSHVHKLTALTLYLYAVYSCPGFTSFHYMHSLYFNYYSLFKGQVHPKMKNVTKICCGQSAPFHNGCMGGFTITSYWKKTNTMKVSEQ